MQETVSRKYILILSGVAVLILVIGAQLRPERKKDTPAPAVPSPSDTAALQRRVQGEGLRESASFLASRADEVSRHVLALDAGRSAVSWGAPGQLLTAGEPGNPAPLVVVSAVAPMPLPPFPSGQVGERWIVLAGRRPEGELLWLPGLNSGLRSRTCAGVSVDELVLNTPLADMPPGTAVFDLDGMLAGVVAVCSGTPRAIAVTSVEKMLDAFRSPRYRLLAVYGFHAVPASEISEGALGSEGQFVREVRVGSIAAQNGLQAGDLILLGEQELPQRLSAAAGGEVPVLPVLRGRRKLALSWKAASEPTDFGLHPAGSASAGVPVDVVPGTAAHKAGLRTGDRVQQVGERTVSNALALRRALAAPADRARVIIFERHESQQAIVVGK